MTIFRSPGPHIPPLDGRVGGHDRRAADAVPAPGDRPEVIWATSDPDKLRERLSTLAGATALTAALYFGVAGVVTLTWIVNEGASLAMLVGYGFGIAAPFVVILAGSPRQQHPGAWAGGVLIGALAGSIAAVVWYPIYRAISGIPRGEFDLAAWLAFSLIATIVYGLPAGVVAWLVAWLRAKVRSIRHPRA